MNEIQIKDENIAFSNCIICLYFYYGDHVIYLRCTVRSRSSLCGDGGSWRFGNLIVGWILVNIHTTNYLKKSKSGIGNDVYLYF